MTPEEDLRTKRILVEFAGGGRDGQIIDSRSNNRNEAALAGFFYLASDGGRTGKGTLGVLDGAISYSLEHGMEPTTGATVPNHVYRAIERLEQEGEVLVRFRYEGPRKPPQKVEELTMS
jgi:hypothetical protein